MFSPRRSHPTVPSSATASEVYPPQAQSDKRAATQSWVAGACQTASRQPLMPIRRTSSVVCRTHTEGPACRFPVDDRPQKAAGRAVLSA